MNITFLIYVLNFVLVACIIGGVIDPVEAFHTKTLVRRRNFQVWYRGEQQQDDAGIIISSRSTAPLSTKGMSYNFNVHGRTYKQTQQQRATAWGQFLAQWRRFRQLLHQLIYRTTVYVLALENDKFYVGSTTNPTRRFREYFDHTATRRTSRWTTLHRPIGIAAQIRRVPKRFLVAVEAQVTAEYMLKYGVNNVRGAYFTNPRNYTRDDIAILTGFLGHYGNLEFKLLEKKLENILPLSSPAAVRRSVVRGQVNLPLVSNNRMETSHWATSHAPSGGVRWEGTRRSATKTKKKTSHKKKTRSLGQ
jgi:predicted GIY-YIG superfamily endonuclease